MYLFIKLSYNAKGVSRPASFAILKSYKSQIETALLARVVRTPSQNVFFCERAACGHSGRWLTSP